MITADFVKNYERTDDARLRGMGTQAYRVEGWVEATGPSILCLWACNDRRLARGVSIVVTSDFNGDGKSDILWQNDNGQVAIWELNGTTVIGGGLVGNPGPSWEVIATGDFYGDGHSDILWQNDSGEVAIWELNGTSVIASASLGNPDPSWHAVATGDFNGDGTSDILFQN